MNIKSLIPSVLFLTLSHLSGAEFFVAPSGSVSGDGSSSRPWDLQTAFNHPASLRPGDTLWLRGGTYRTTSGPTEPRSFDCRIVGTEASPILIKQYPGEAAVVDGGIQSKPGSAWYQFWGFRITCTDPDRLVTSATDSRPTGLFINGLGVKVINMVIDNNSTPIFWADSGSPTGDNGEIYGCIIWGGGVYDAYTPPGTIDNPWIRGSAIYAQNVNGSRTIADNICFRNFTSGPLLYGEEGQANGFTLEGNISFDPAAGAAFEAATKNYPITSVNIVNNYAFSEKPGNLIRLGYQSKGNQNAYVVGNYAAGLGAGTTGLFSIKNWDSATIRNNIFYSWGPNKAVASIDRTGGLSSFPFNWNYTTYHASNSWPFVTNNSMPSLNFSEWKNATGYDRQSTFSSSAPTGLVGFTRRNKYDPARSHLVVYNWNGGTSCSYDLAEAGLVSGDAFEIRDAQNYLGAPVLTGNYTGAPITLPLALTEVSPIYGTLTHFTNRHTPSSFNAFVIAKTAQATPPKRPRGRKP